MGVPLWTRTHEGKHRRTSLRGSVCTPNFSLKRPIRNLGSAAASGKLIAKGTIRLGMPLRLPSAMSAVSMPMLRSPVTTIRRTSGKRRRSLRTRVHSTCMPLRDRKKRGRRSNVLLLAVEEGTTRSSSVTAFTGEDVRGKPSGVTASIPSAQVRSVSPARLESRQKIGWKCPAALKAFAIGIISKKFAFESGRNTIVPLLLSMLLREQNIFHELADDVLHSEMRLLRALLVFSGHRDHAVSISLQSFRSRECDCHDSFLFCLFKCAKNIF